MKRAVVIGGDHHNTLGVIRSLGRGGVYPYVILTTDNKDSFILRSKYISKSWVVDDSEKAISILKNDIAKEGERSVVIACHDKISSCLDLNRDSLIRFYYLPGTEESGLVTKYMDKELMGKMASQCGLNVPVCSKIVNGDIPKDWTAFPVIIKPIESKEGTKADIRVFKSSAEIQSSINLFMGKTFLMQHFVSKEFEYQLIGCSLFGGEEVIIPGYSRILRQSESSNTGFLVYDVLDSAFGPVIDSIKALFQTMEFSGLFSAEFIRGIDGNDYFLEINFRNDGNAISVTHSGVNLPLLWYKSCCGMDYIKEINSVHKELVMPEFQELGLYGSGSITLKRLLGDMSSATSYMDYAPDDPKPTKGWLVYYTLLLKVIIKRIFRMNKR